MIIKKYRISRRLGQILSLSTWGFAARLALENVPAAARLGFPTWAAMVAALSHNWLVLGVLTTAAMTFIVYGYSHDDEGNQQDVLPFIPRFRKSGSGLD